MAGVDHLIPCAFVICGEVSQDERTNITFGTVFTQILADKMPYRAQFFVVVLGFAPPRDYPLVIDVVSPSTEVTPLLSDQLESRQGYTQAMWIGKAEFNFHAEGWYEFRLSLDSTYFTSYFLKVGTEIVAH